jgi:hypothetical protein
MENSEKTKSTGRWAAFISDPKTIERLLTTVTIIAGVIISVNNLKITTVKNSETRKIEASTPFLKLRQEIYLDALKNASILASKELHTEEEVKAARKRFTELLWGESSLIEETRIEKFMIAIAESENLRDSITPTQKSSYDLAHAMRESLIKSWGVDTAKVGNVHE